MDCNVPIWNFRTNIIGSILMFCICSVLQVVVYTEIHWKKRSTSLHMIQLEAQTSFHPIYRSQQIVYLIIKQEKKTFWDHQCFKTALYVLANEPGLCPCCLVHPTLALMMVGLGSKMPCIFLKAGMTKRLQVTTADTGFPRTDGQTQKGEREGKNIWVTSLQRQRSESLFLSTSHTTWEGKD